MINHLIDTKPFPWTLYWSYVSICSAPLDMLSPDTQHATIWLWLMLYHLSPVMAWLITWPLCPCNPVLPVLC